MANYHMKNSVQPDSLGLSLMDISLFSEKDYHRKSKSKKVKQFKRFSIEYIFFNILLLQLLCS